MLGDAAQNGSTGGEPATGTSPTFSVIVPTCRREEALVECLAALTPERQRVVGDAFEIVVTDDGGVGRVSTAVKSRFPNVGWVDGPGRGPAANRNRGVAAARGEWLAFTDDDCRPADGWLAAFLAVARARPEAAVMEGRTVAPEAAGQGGQPGQQAPINETGGLLWSCNFAIRAALFRQLGGFDERFPYACMEDVELLYRLRRRGCEPLFVPAATVVHPWRAWDAAAEWRRYPESVAIYLAIHPGERCRIGGRMQVREALRTLVRDGVPGLAKGNWPAARFALLKAGVHWRAAWAVARPARRPADDRHRR